MVDNGIESQAVNPSMKLLRTWNNPSPLTQESEVISKWYIGMWETKKSKNLCIGRLMKQFLDEEDGKVFSVEMSCLKPKVGLETIMEETPENLPDVAIFKIEDIIDGPITALTMKRKK